VLVRLDHVARVIENANHALSLPCGEQKRQILENLSELGFAVSVERHEITSSDSFTLSPARLNKPQGLDVLAETSFSAIPQIQLDLGRSSCSSK
jgi:hypothetical protein